MAAAYRHRPPYPDEAIDVVVALLGPRPWEVLEIGAGSGDFTEPLAARVDHVTAVEPSRPMVDLGRARTKGRDVTWVHGTAEAFTPSRSYGAIVAAESLHWMEWDVVLPRLARCVRPGGRLILVTRGLAAPPPWDEDLRALIRRYSTNEHYRPFDLVAELEARMLFESEGEATTAPTEFTQPLGDYVESFHSRNGFSRERMPAEAAIAFDCALAGLVSSRVADGCVHLTTSASIRWGSIRRDLGAA